MYKAPPPVREGARQKIVRRFCRIKLDRCAYTECATTLTNHYIRPIRASFGLTPDNFFTSLSGFMDESGATYVTFEMGISEVFTSFRGLPDDFAII